jgi:hypothetical protein
MIIKLFYLNDDSCKKFFYKYNNYMKKTKTKRKKERSSKSNHYLLKEDCVFCDRLTCCSDFDPHHQDDQKWN